MCNAAGYRLITIFSDEWIHKNVIVKTKLRYILGYDTESIYARNCEIRDVSKADVSMFLDNNHIQGYWNGAGKISYGLYNDECLVAVMSLRKLNDGVYDLNRFASTKRVVGGFSKLLKHFEKSNDWHKIFTYADLRWSKGDLYNVNGFDFVKNTSLNYFYINGTNRDSRQKYRKSKLTDMVGYDQSLTEFQITENLGILRIYDCGNAKYEKSNID